MDIVQSLEVHIAHTLLRRTNIVRKSVKRPKKGISGQKTCIAVLNGITEGISCR